MVCPQNYKKTVLIVALVVSICFLLAVFQPPTAFQLLQLQANRAPVIYSVTASPLGIQAGQFITFDAIANDPDRDELSFLWDFGDGSSTSGKKIKHVFNLRPGQFSQSFAVTLTVSDESGATASQQVNVKVERAFFLIKVSQLEENDFFDKGSPINLKIHLEESGGKIIGSQDVYFIKARLQDQEVSLTASEDYGVFEGQLTVPFQFAAQDELFFEASAFAAKQPRFTNTFLRLNFRPVPLTLNVSTLPQTLSDETVIQSVYFSLLYSDGSEVTQADIKAKLDGLDLNFFRKAAYFEASDLNFKALQANNSKIVVESIDDGFGNTVTNQVVPLTFGVSDELVSVDGQEPGEDANLDQLVLDQNQQVSDQLVLDQNQQVSDQLVLDQNQQVSDQLVLDQNQQVSGQPFVPELLLSVFDFEVDLFFWGGTIGFALVVIVVLLVLLRKFMAVPEETASEEAEEEEVEEKKAEIQPVKPKKFSEKDIDKAIAKVKRKFRLVLPSQQVKAKERLAKLRELVKEKSLKQKMDESSEEDEATDKEAQAVQAMVELLRPYKNKYSEREVEEAALAEGYTQRQARLIAKKLYAE